MRAAVELGEEERRRLRNRKKREGRERRFREQPPDETGRYARCGKRGIAHQWLGKERMR